MDRFEARKRLVADLEAAGLLAAVEDRVIPIPTCYRSGDVVEPYLLDQWFVYMKPLAEPALAAVEEGRDALRARALYQDLPRLAEPFKDWCISRQLWWGTRSPPGTWCARPAARRSTIRRWSWPDRGRGLREGRASLREESRLVQDEDVLDTWFSSALWPFSTMGWPDKTPDLETFYPGDVLVTGRDIIYFWVARMVFSGLKFTGKAPFHTRVHPRHHTGREGPADVQVQGQRHRSHRDD